MLEDIFSSEENQISLLSSLSLLCISFYILFSPPFSPHLSISPLPFLAHTHTSFLLLVLSLSFSHSFPILSPILNPVSLAPLPFPSSLTSSYQSYLPLMHVSLCPISFHHSLSLFCLSSSISPLSLSSHLIFSLNITLFSSFLCVNMFLCTLSPFFIFKIDFENNYIHYFSGKYKCH